nr:hypothetical protein BgiMline_010096 [Biomphalaria glabrata]
MGSKLSTQHNMERNKKEDKADLHLTENQCVIYNKEGHTAPHTVSRLSEDAQYSGHLKIQKSGDLHKSLARCLKNPGYSHFIPVDTFTLKHLPEENNYEYDLYEYIKVTADLTVRVDAKATSQHRPEFWPETTKPYPFYNMSDRGTMRTGSQRRNLRTGSGKVCGVIKYHGRVTHDEDYRRIQHLKCWCKKCEDSDSPSNVWWEFDVDTATHVVFDDIEASQTTLRLFYDRYNSLEVIVDKGVAAFDMPPPLGTSFYGLSSCL